MIIQTRNIFSILAIFVFFCFVSAQTDTIDAGKHAKVLIPSGGEIYKVGDTLRFKFLADNTVGKSGGYAIKVSIDSGKTFGQNYIQHIIAPNDTNIYYQPSDPDFKNIPWVIPDTLEYLDSRLRIKKLYMVSDQVVLQLNDVYNSLNQGYTYNSGVFSIIPNDTTRIENKIQPYLQAHFNVMIKDNVLFSTSPVAIVRVVDIMGRTVASFGGNDCLKIDLKSNLKSGIAAGAYKISVQSVKGETSVVNWAFVR